MGAIAVFNEFRDEIQQLFRSELRLMILLSLYKDGKSLPELEKITESASSAIITKNKLWIDYGFVKKDDNRYILTTSGHIITKKLILLLNCIDIHRSDRSDIPERKFHDEKSDPEALIRIYHDNVDMINNIVRSYITMTILLSLVDGEKTRDEFKDITGSTSPVITPKIRWLSINSLTEENKKGIFLTSKGKALINNIESFIVTAATLIKHRDYWKVHIIDELPDFALDNIGDLFYTKQVYDTPEEPFKNYENWMNIIAEAGYLHSVSNYATPGVSDAIAKKAMEGVPMDLVISGELAMKIFTEPYIKYMKDYQNYPHMQWLIGNFPRIVGFTVTDKCFTIKFSGNAVDVFDTSSGLVSRTKEAREWGEKLYQYYKSSAIPISQFIMDKDRK